MYNQSPKYLKEGGIFITIVGGRSQGIALFVRNQAHPDLPWRDAEGIPHPGSDACGSHCEGGRELVDSGAIKEGLVDSEFEFEDVPKVEERKFSGFSTGNPHHDIPC